MELFRCSRAYISHKFFMQSSVSVLLLLGDDLDGFILKPGVSVLFTDFMVNAHNWISMLLLHKVDETKWKLEQLTVHSKLPNFVSLVRDQKCRC